MGLHIVLRKRRGVDTLRLPFAECFMKFLYHPPLGVRAKRFFFASDEGSYYSSHDFTIFINLQDLNVRTVLNVCNILTLIFSSSMATQFY